MMRDINIVAVGFSSNDTLWLRDIIGENADEYYGLQPYSPIYSSHQGTVNFQFTTVRLNTYLGSLDREDHAPADIILLASNDNFESTQSVVSQLRQHPNARNSDIVVIDCEKDANTEIHEVQSLKYGAREYWTRSSSITQIYLRLLRMIAIRYERQQLEALSETDSLTNTGNRRSFDRFIQSEWRRALRECSGLGLIMLDIDYFKAFNDFYGHVHGDDCLRQIADIVRTHLLRPGDFVARYGGEEFVIVLPNIQINGVEHVALRLEAAIKSANIQHGGVDEHHRVTVSMGLSWCQADPRIHYEILLRAADEALYGMKSAGRNRCSDVIDVSAGALAKLSASNPILGDTFNR